MVKIQAVKTKKERLKKAIKDTLPFAIWMLAIYLALIIGIEAGEQRGELNMCNRNNGRLLYNGDCVFIPAENYTFSFIDNGYKANPDMTGVLYNASI